MSEDPSSSRRQRRSGRMARCGARVVANVLEWSNCLVEALVPSDRSKRRR